MSVHDDLGARMSVAMSERLCTTSLIMSRRRSMNDCICL